jgi:FG-GAP-like repeat/FG-GAP repeat
LQLDVRVAHMITHAPAPLAVGSSSRHREDRSGEGEDDRSRACRGPAAGDPYSLNAADFNGDGRPDVATINGTSSDVSVFLRQAGGGFAQEAGSPISVGFQSGPSGAAVGDYNGDGRTDLAVSNFVAGNVAVLLRQPGGGFALEGGAAIPLGTRISGVAAGDFNSDGRLDLAASEYDCNQVVVLLRNGQNTGFSALPQFATGLTPVAIAVGDYNGDGLADLAIANRGGDSVTILLRVPGGTFISEASADFFDGLFKLTQTKGSMPLTTLTLTERLSCPRKASASAAAKTKKKRRLWGDGSGRFRTKGKHSAATVVGTRWLTQDRCASTLTRVVRGTVRVRDLVKRKTVIVRAGKRYTARAKRR